MNNTEKNNLPNIFDQAKSFGSSIADWAIKDGLKKVPPDIFEMRKKICSECEHWDATAFNGTGRCKVCGCSVAKLHIPSSKCPLPDPKWRGIIIQDSPSKNSNVVVTDGNVKLPLKVVNRTPPKPEN
jgi:hypothetical protein